MKKLILLSALILFLPLLIKAQINVKDEINVYVDKSVSTIQDLNSKLVDEYGLKEIQFVKFENGKYIPVKAGEVKKITEIQFSSDVILIFAIIGAVLVGLILLRSL